MQSDLKGAETRCSTCVCYDKGKSPRAFLLNFYMGKTGMVHTPLTPVLESQRQIDLCKYKASLVYIVSSRLARATQRDSVSKKKKKGIIWQLGLSLWLRALTTLAENPALIPNPHMMPTTLCNYSPGDVTPPLTFKDTRNTYSVCVRIHTHTHT